jgi:hypothetical protein
MYRIERDSGQVNKIHVTIEATIEAKVAKIGWDPIGIGAVIAEHGYRDFGSSSVGSPQSRDCVRDVEDELIIATLVDSDQGRPNTHTGGLPCALKVEDRAACVEGVGNIDFGSVPALTAVVRLIGVAGVCMIETVRQDYRLPEIRLLLTPDLPDSIELAPPVLPVRIQSPRRLHWAALRRRNMDDCSQRRRKQCCACGRRSAQQKLPAGALKHGGLSSFGAAQNSLLLKQSHIQPHGRAVASDSPFGSLQRL